MAVTENNYTGNGSTTNYSFTFPYLNESDVKVSLDDVDQPTTAYSFANATTISFNVAPSNGVAVRIYRQTAQDVPPASFFAGSAIRAQDLNENFLQQLYVAQETDNIARNLTAGDIAPGAITNNLLADNAVTETKIANSSVTSAKIVDGTIVNADINASAEIAVSKLADGTARQLLQTDAAGTGVEWTDNVDVPGTLDVTGAATFDSTVTATGAATFNSTVTATGAATFDSTVTAAGDVTVPSLNGGPLAGTRNRIINGDMRIDQRNAGAAFTPTTDGQYGGPDRWAYWLSQPSKYSVQQSTAAPTGFSSSLLITSLSSYAVTGNDYFAVLQKIEGFNFADMMWGTANAQPVTLSFWVRSSLTGTFGGAMTNSATNRSYPFSYTISEANTWEQKSVIIAGDTSGTWVGATNGVGAMAQFSLGAVSARLGTAGTWVGDWAVGSTGSTSIVATNGATFYITGVQLEAGTVATPFERRSYGQELALCQRYYEIVSGSMYASYSITGVGSILPAYFKVNKRTTPTMNTLSGSFNQYDNISVRGFSFGYNGSTVGPTTWTGSAAASSEL